MVVAHVLLRRHVVAAVGLGPGFGAHREISKGHVCTFSFFRVSLLVFWCTCIFSSFLEISAFFVSSMYEYLVNAVIFKKK
jgi:hypothetical protein